MKALYLIPARGGSKGLPGKNVLLLNGKPLIHYSIEVAKALTSPGNICVSTDDPSIKEVAEKAGVAVPFLRPGKFSTDEASMDGVIRHALEFYAIGGNFFDIIVLLQPTSPLRTVDQVRNAIAQYEPDLDMVMSVFETKANPYFVLFEQDGNFLIKSKAGNFDTRQSVPKVYQANGAIYVINANAIKDKSLKQFTKIKKFEMDKMTSVDIDDKLDFKYCEFLLSQGLVNT